MANLVELMATPNRVEARLVATVLEEAGLHPTILSEGLASVLGAGEIAIPCRVMVPQSELEEAGSMVAEMQRAASRETEGGAPDHCPDCGATWEPGFDVCWQCGPGHDGPGAVSFEKGSEDQGIEGIQRTLERRRGVAWVGVPVVGLALVVVSLFFPLSTAITTLAVGALAVVVAWWMLFAPVQLQVDLHALHVDGERLLWDDLESVEILADRIRWRMLDHSEDEVRAVIDDDDRAILSQAISRLMARPKAPRSRADEQAAQRLSKASKGKARPTQPEG